MDKNLKQNLKQIEDHFNQMGFALVLEFMAKNYPNHLVTKIPEDSPQFPDMLTLYGKSERLSDSKFRALVIKEFGKNFYYSLVMKRVEIAKQRVAFGDVKTKSHCRKCFGRGYVGYTPIYARNKDWDGKDLKTKFLLDAQGKKIEDHRDYTICNCVINQMPISNGDERNFRETIIEMYLSNQKPIAKEPEPAKPETIKRTKKAKPVDGIQDTPGVKVRTKKPKPTATDQ